MARCGATSSASQDGKHESKGPGFYTLQKWHLLMLGREFDDELKLERREDGSCQRSAG